MQHLLKYFNKVPFLCLTAIVLFSSNLFAVSIQLDNFNSQEQTIDVLYDFEEDIAGFQFDVTGLSLSGASGGSSNDNGFEVAVGTSTVLGFSWTGGVIPSGSGLLTTLSFSDITADEACLGDVILSVDPDFIACSDNCLAIFIRLFIRSPVPIL